MTISIAMCTYNGERYLEEQLRSIASQTLQASELVICDDGSTDATASIVESFRQSVPFPVHFHRNLHNLGSTKNFEQAIHMCNGEIIALCDQDDVWFPEKLSRMVAVLERNPGVAGVFSNARLLDGNGQYLAEDLWSRAMFTKKRQAAFRRATGAAQLANFDTVTGATFLFRSAFCELILPISTEWVHDGWIALILAAVAEVRPLPECLMSYRLHTSQQIGIRKLTWHERLTARKDKALAMHKHGARRFTEMAEKLESLAAQGYSVDLGIAARMRRRARYLQRRANLLERPRANRFLTAAALLPDYFRFQNGFVSLFRDLLHE